MTSPPMPTDDVLSLIAEVRQLCDGMPSGPYTKIATLDFNEGFFTTLHLGTTEDDEYVHFGDQNQHHARYFAALDPALVRALLDYVRSDLALRGVIDSLHGGSRARLTAAEDDFEAADVALRSLAAERVTD